MARVKISEFRAKTILFSELASKYSGFCVTQADNLERIISSLSDDHNYVIKIDQGIKKRQKEGLLFTNIEKTKLTIKARDLFGKGFDNLLIENFIPHLENEEYFLSLERLRAGVFAYYSKKGGVDIEQNSNQVKYDILNDNTFSKIDDFFKFKSGITKKIYSVFEDQYFSFLETNPFLVRDGKPDFLDLAVEVDDTAENLTGIKWMRSDFVQANFNLTPEESAVKSLADKSSASLKLKVLNPNGSIFTIFSGGGASIVLADEIGNTGKVSELANYAEYSGNPNEDETYLFTKNILSLVEKSTGKNKVIYIAGGVANFTDIRSTFKGVIKALEEYGDELNKLGVKVYVRRGGPYQEEGLKMMRECLQKLGILGRVAGPEEILTDIIIKK